jgi:septum formation protein
MIILASKSAARRAVLEGAGVAFTALGSEVDEDLVKADHLARGEGPQAIAATLAAEKALAVSRQHPDALVIGSDQTLDLEGQLFDKVADLDALRERLRLMRGKPHQLHSATALARGGAVIWSEIRSARLTMRDFSDAFLETYLAEHGAEALSSVGCYRLEAAGVQLFSAIEGDYFTILGLPLMGLLETLRTEGVLAR